MSEFSLKQQHHQQRHSVSKRPSITMDISLQIPRLLDVCHCFFMVQFEVELLSREVTRPKFSIHIKFISSLVCLSFLGTDTSLVLPLNIAAMVLL